MIKIFRHIRKQLLSQNRVGKYFKYAIGEIVLVVIGILFALQINNWNEGRKNHNEAIAFLQNLKVDLNKDFEQINRVVDIQTKRFNFLDSLINVSRNLSHKNESGDNKILRTGRNETFFPVIGTYKSAQQNGVIDKLKNEKLKFAIINLYEHHYIRLSYNGELNDQRHEDVEWKSRAYIHHDVLGFNFSSSALNDKDFINQISYLNKFTNIYKSRAVAIKVAMVAILKMLDEELNK